jgi:hypothetical protein
LKREGVLVVRYILTRTRSIIWMPMINKTLKSAKHRLITLSSGILKLLNQGSGRIPKSIIFPRYCMPTYYPPYLTTTPAAMYSDMATKPPIKPSLFHLSSECHAPQIFAGRFSLARRACDDMNSAEIFLGGEKHSSCRDWARTIRTRMTSPFNHLLLLLLLASSLPLEADTGQDSARWYQFEVVVFQRIAPGSGSTESWHPNPGTPPRDNVQFLSRGNSMQNHQPVAYRQLPSGDRELSKVWQILRHSKNYRPLYHLAWRQPVKHPKNSKPVYFSLPGQDGHTQPKLEGTVKFGIKRYLHMDVDIVLRLPPSNNQTYERDDHYLPSYQSYRMREQRRMRSRKLNYLDHPVLGVLTIAQRYQAPAHSNEQTPEPSEPASP